ncbi:K02A2.6-like [Cordylochernes scorpioides]|uniref:RNA-directed DNA polymerase n=1 Tax=Cordylochernes scorpioides TaxID=51811 RepID=A0ABY6LSJ8_9ARAC|nr:K02A2.6-like [Cordylochernes scorpioides]
MAQIQPPETFDFSTPNEWPKWRKRFERYLVVSGMKKKEEADKIDLFMYLMGDRADDIFRTFKFEKEEEATKIDSVLEAFDSHFCVRKNIIYECAKFNSRIQEDREPVDEFITSLYKLADSCEFEGLHEQLIRDRIVVGVRDKALSERMQLDSELSLEKAVKMVRQQEAVRQQQVDLQRPSRSQKVNQVKFNSKKQSPKQQQQPSRKKEKSAKTRSRCPKCGRFTHRDGQACRAEGQRCNLCSKTGHFANCCPDKQAKTAEVSAVEDSSNLDDDEGECRRRWTAEIQVNGKQVKFKLDSQADVTCVPLCLFKKIMGQQRLVESDINIRAAEFSELQTVGMFISTLRNGNYEIKEKIYVIRRLSEPLLSRRACELLNLARRIEVVATRINPIKEFPEVFEGLGQIGNPYEIKLKPGAKPYAVHTPRRVPIPLMEKLKTRLDIPGKELLDADALSRQPLLATEGGEDERPTSAHINAVLSSITDKDEMLTKIFEAQQEDTTLKADWNGFVQALLSYWHVKDELGIQNGLLMRSCRLVIPASMKLEILDKLHAGHFGITKTRLRARETVWWPGISEEIAETVRKCSVCIQEAVSKHEPLIPTNFPTRLWQKIGMDLFKFENKWYLVVIDYYSRFPEMIQLDRLTANVVALLSYWHVKDELGIQNGLLMRSCRLVIPASMKLEILDKLHAGHFGITKTRLRARETVWWPGISEEIAETVRKCSVCIQEAVSKHEPLIPTNFPTRLWQKIGMDLFKFENKWYLVVIDYYSRFPEMIQLDRLTANVVAQSCKSIFARHGIPETVVSDNGTQFGAACEFANFARQYGFTHVTSSPRFPQSNGMAEAGVKIAKLILKKNQDPSLGLLEYRSTPLENGYSPAELLMGRKLRTTLPIAPENLNPKLVDSQTLKRKEGRRRKDMKSRYDRRCGATDMEELSEGDTVWITDMRTWGIVKQKASTPRSYMVDTPVGTLRRNRFHLRKGDTVQYPADPSTPTFSREELVENEKTPVVDYPSNDSEDGQIRTRKLVTKVREASRPTFLEWSRDCSSLSWVALSCSKHCQNHIIEISPQDWTLWCEAHMIPWFRANGPRQPRADLDPMWISWNKVRPRLTRAISPKPWNHRQLIICPAFLRQRMQTVILLELTYLSSYIKGLPSRLDHSMYLPIRLVQLDNPLRV